MIDPSKLKTIRKPYEGEFPPSAIQYITLLPDDGGVLPQMWSNLASTQDLLRSIPAEKLTYRYAKGKWTIKEILGHLTDDERIYSYRALRIGRNDTTQLAGFEPEDYVQHSNANYRNLADLIDEFAAVRVATLTLFNSFTEEAILRKGIVNDNTVSVSAAIYHIAGHELHHLNIIRERYL
jgi:uncharacterized damage-inducible protein DinB